MAAPHTALAALGERDTPARARAAAVLGHGGRWARGTAAALTESAAHDPAPEVRRAALRSLARRAHPNRAAAAWSAATRDADDGVRRTAAEVAPALIARDRRAAVDVIEVLVALLDDGAPLVAEAAAFALGEVQARVGTDTGTGTGTGTDTDADKAHEATVVAALVRHGRAHADPLVREACVAALGALAGAGPLTDEATVVGALLAAVGDKPAIRRRAVIALSAFEGDDVDAALAAARDDRDWQVRMLAEDLSEE